MSVKSESDIRGSQIPYHRLGVFPYFVGFCASENAWNKEMRRINVLNNDWTAPLSAATHPFHNCGGYHLSIVTLNRGHHRTRPLAETVGALAHEATHVIQHFMNRIGERSPSEEFQAYMIEDVTRWLFEQFRGAK